MSQELLDALQVLGILASVGVGVAAIWIGWHQSRIATQAIKEAAYDSLQADYSSLARMMLENPHLRHLYGSACDIVRPRWNKYTDTDKDLYLYITCVYDILDRVYRLRNRGWMPDSEWEAWNEWLLEAVDYRMFPQVHEDGRGQYPKELTDFIDDAIAAKQLSNETAAAEYS